MQTSFFNQCYYEFFKSDLNSLEAVIFIHGFPGRREDKNRDLVPREVPYDVYLLHHQGLGKSKGQFKFSESITNFLAFYQFILSKGYKKVHLVGHSWGGFIALSTMKEILKTDARMIIFSPFLKIPKGEDLTALINAIYHTAVPYVGHMKQSDVLSDLKYLSLKHNFEHFKNYLLGHDVHLTIIQATNDIETPAELARQFVQGLTKVKYIELETDHGFESHRSDLKELIANTLIKV